MEDRPKIAPGRSGARRRRRVLGAAATVALLGAAGCDLGVPPTRLVVARSGATAVDVVAGDVDHDGDVDLVATTTEGYAVARNDGAGAFSVSRYPTPGTVGGSPALGDTDHVDTLDIARSHPAGPNPHITLDFGFASLPSLDLPAPGPIVTEPVMADLDGDGDDDVLAGVADESYGSTMYWWASRSGWPPEATRVSPNYLPPVSDVMVTDLDGDGHNDIVAAMWFEAQRGIGVLRGTGGGAFAPLELHDLDIWYDTVAQAALGDVDGDGHLDVVGITGQYPSDGQGNLFALLNDGDGGLGEPVYSRTTARDGTLAMQDDEVALGDVDGDGALDVATGAAVLFGAGDGTFASPHEVAVGEEPVLADFDGDGADDLATVEGDAVVVMLNGLDSGEG